MSLLSQSLLREGGWTRHNPGGWQMLLGVSISERKLNLVAGRWDIYARGILGRDSDAEAISILVLTEVFSKPLSQMTEDIFDLVSRARSRMAEMPGVEQVITATDLGGSEAGGEGYLLASAIREQVPVSMALRTVSDADLPQPTWDVSHRAWKMAPEALTGALAARAGARQVLIDDEATTDAKRILTMALRDAGSVDARLASGLVRVIAWMSEICMRPLVEPYIDKEGTHLLGDGETTQGIRMVR